MVPVEMNFCQQKTNTKVPGTHIRFRDKSLEHYPSFIVLSIVL